MTLRLLAVVMAALLALAGCGGIAEQVRDRLDGGGALDAATVAAGLREALSQGTAKAVAQLGRTDGFWTHPKLRIPVPENLQRVERGLRRVRQDRIADDFVRTLNRAAEQATPAARDIFVDAIRAMTIQDAFEILRGPPDAATQYFRRHTQTRLAAAFRPIVARATDSAGVTAAYKRVVQAAAPLRLVDDSRLDLDSYVTEKTLAALFQMIADEERRIREDPRARTTELLRRVFR